MDAVAEGVLAFWLDEVGPEGWFDGGAALDAACRERFLETWERARAGRNARWAYTARGSLAAAILLDQLPRNMFRGEARAFATDAAARGVVKAAIARERDLQISGLARQFFYLPLMHSEVLADQERAVRLFLMRLNELDYLQHARAHRAIIRRFGRFPTRNAALGRTTTPAEAAWLAEGGYARSLAEAA